MPLPPKGNPRRPLHLAVRSTRLLGIVFLCFGMIVMLPSLLLLRRGMGMPLMIVQFISAMLYIGPGVLYLVCAIFLKQRQFWAVVVGIVLASIHLLFLLLGAAFYIAVVLSEQFNAWMLAPMVMLLAFILALGRLIYHLARSFEAIKYPPDEQRGFEPLMVEPIAHAGSLDSANNGIDAQHKHPG
jgi:hypothetical protein